MNERIMHIYSTLLYLFCGGLSIQNEEEKDEEAPTVRRELVNMP